MNSGEFLEKPELHQLTGFAKSGPQAAWLTAEGIPFKENGKGLIVCRVHVRAWVEGRPVVSSGGLNWSTVK